MYNPAAPALPVAQQLDALRRKPAGIVASTGKPRRWQQSLPVPAMAA
jgi:hypothetical protein